MSNKSIELAISILESEKERLSKDHIDRLDEIANFVAFSRVQLTQGLETDAGDGLSSKTAIELIRSGKGHRVAMNLDRFHDISYQEIADELIKNRKGHCVANHFNLFYGLDAQETANKLIDWGCGNALAANLQKFKGLDHQAIADKLIATRQGYALVTHLKKFRGLNHQKLADKLVEANNGEYAGYVAEKIDNFQDLDPEFVEKLKQELGP